MHRSTTRVTKTAPAMRTRASNSFRVFPQKRAGKPVPSVLAEHIASWNLSPREGDRHLFRKKAQRGISVRSCPRSRAWGLSAVILLQSSCRYSSKSKSANVLLIRAMRYKLADSWGMQRQNLAEMTQNTGNRGQKTHGVETAICQKSGGRMDEDLFDT